MKTRLDSSNKDSQNSEKKTIRTLMVIGDSQSDRGIFYAGERWGTYLVNKLGVFSQSPKSRFTNGLLWVDYLAASLMNQLTVDDLLDQKPNHSLDYLDLATNENRSKKHITTIEDIADGIISDKKIKKEIDRYDLNNPREIRYQEKVFLRSYSEGGLCNHNYNFKLFSKKAITRLLVPYLSNKISEIKKDDEDRVLQNKQETLSIIWSGMNDLGLVNDPLEPTYKDKSRLSIASLEKNINELLESGYCHFLLLNAPDATLSSRFGKLPQHTIMFLKEGIDYFNQKLAKLVVRLRRYYPRCSFDLYDVNAQCKDIFNNPELYNLDKDKVDKTYVTSPDFKPITSTGAHAKQPSPGYLFWDEVHPTTYVHYLIAHEVEKTIRSRYEIKPPELESHYRRLTMI